MLIIMNALQHSIQEGLRSQNNSLCMTFPARWGMIKSELLLFGPLLVLFWIHCLSQEESLEKEMAILSSILAWRIPWTKKTVRIQSMESQRVGHQWGTNTIYGNRIQDLDVSPSTSSVYPLLHCHYSELFSSQVNTVSSPLHLSQ